MKMLTLLRYAKVAFEEQYKFDSSIVGGFGINSTNIQDLLGLPLLQAKSSSLVSELSAPE